LKKLKLNKNLYVNSNNFFLLQRLNVEPFYLDPRLFRSYDFSDSFITSLVKQKSKNFFDLAKPLKQHFIKVPKFAFSKKLVSIPFFQVAIEKDKPFLLHYQEWYNNWFWRLSLRRLKLKESYYKSFAFSKKVRFRFFRKFFFTSRKAERKLRFNIYKKLNRSFYSKALRRRKKN